MKHLKTRSEYIKLNESINNIDLSEIKNHIRENTSEYYIKLINDFINFNIDTDTLIKADYEKMKYAIKEKIKLISKKSINDFIFDIIKRENLEVKTIGDFIQKFGTFIDNSDKESAKFYPKINILSILAFDGIIKKGWIPLMNKYEKEIYDFISIPDNLKELEVALNKKLKQIKEKIVKREPKKDKDEVVEQEKKLMELYKQITRVNEEKLKKLVSDIEESFKELSEKIFKREKERILNNIKIVKAMPDINYEKMQSYINYRKVFEPLEKVLRLEQKKISSKWGSKYDKMFDIEYYEIPELNSNWEVNLDKGIKDYIETLKYPLISSIVKNFIRINEPIKNIVKEYVEVGNKGMEGVFFFEFENGSSFNFKTEGILAGGYNIQCLHIRYITDFKDVKLKDGSKLSSASLYEIEKNFSTQKEKNPNINIDNTKSTEELIDYLYNYLKTNPDYFTNIRKYPNSISYKNLSKSRAMYFGNPPDGKGLMDLPEAKEKAKKYIDGLLNPGN